MSRGRGQLVVLSAGVVAVALGAVLLTALQLGAHPDVRASTAVDAGDRLADGRRLLEVAVHDAAADVSATYPWSGRTAAVDDVRRRLDADREALAASHVERGIAYRTRYNRTAASRWANTDCPDGPDRQFGPCEADRGVVVQERAGETHVLAVALDVQVTSQRGSANATIVVRSRP